MLFVRQSANIFSVPVHRTSSRPSWMSHFTSIISIARARCSGGEAPSLLRWS